MITKSCHKYFDEGQGFKEKDTNKKYLKDFIVIDLINLDNIQV